MVDDFIESSDDPVKYKQQLVEEMGTLVIHAVHGDHISQLPENAVCLGSSERTENEIWKLGDRVLAIQSHPEFSAELIETLIINRIYDDGGINDMQKDDFM